MRNALAFIQSIPQTSYNYNIFRTFFFTPHAADSHHSRSCANPFNVLLQLTAVYEPMRGEAKSTLQGVIVGVYVCPPSNARSISKDTPIMGAKVAWWRSASVLFRMLQKLRSLTVGGATKMYKNNASLGCDSLLAPQDGCGFFPPGRCAPDVTN
jgi:hypothetical protein